ncbi:uncharacterized protein LOC126839904 [Adelges cooleyi]|uniref:uncharacterized protein LOC126839904 n=1 Tax=Adelges cooleyi TaxID=133065 RepID=UPI0021801DC4|nr:uncharacterized protein LOC126839904 [Adelges cooleyi]
MYLKNIILFLSVALYFLQCHGAYPTPEELETIKNIVKEYGEPNGINIEENDDLTINLNGVKDIIKEVAERLNIHKAPPSLVELQTSLSNYKFTLSDVKYYVENYSGLTVLRPEVIAIVELLFFFCEKPNGINFEDLSVLLGEIQEAYANLVAEFRYIDEPKTAIPYKMANLEYKFTRKEVESIVIDYLFSG